MRHLVIFLVYIVCAYCEGISYQRVSIKDESEYEQNLQANLLVHLPGKVRGIYDASITQYDAQTNDAMVSDEVCRIITDKISHTSDSNDHVIISELIPQTKGTTKFVKLGFFSTSTRSDVYILTNEKDVLKVNLDDAPRLDGVVSIKDQFTDAISSTNPLWILSNSVSNRVYIISASTIVSNKDLDNFQSSSFEIEDAHLPKDQMFHAMTFDSYVVLSCGQQGLIIYKIQGTNKILTWHKMYKFNAKYAAYHQESNTIAFIDNNGVHFIKIGEDGTFPAQPSTFYVTYSDGIRFSHSNLQTFWITDKNGFQITEIVADFKNSISENRGARSSGKKILQLYLNDIFGWVFNTDEYYVYIHSIPRAIASSLRNKIATFSMESIVDVDISQRNDRFKVVGITDKTLKIHQLQYAEPTFGCDPREVTGKYLYKLRVYSKECQSDQPDTEFYYCLANDSFIINVNRSYITSSDQDKAILAIIIVVALILLIFAVFCICYRSKKRELTEMEVKARDLRKLKYQELQQEKALNISETNI